MTNPLVRAVTKGRRAAPAGVETSHRTGGRATVGTPAVVLSGGYGRDPSKAAVERYADLVEDGIDWVLEQPAVDEDDIGGAVTLYDALAAADHVGRRHLRRAKRAELEQLATIGLAVAIHSLEIHDDLRKVARSQSYSRFPPPPSDLETGSVPTELDLAAVAVEEPIEEGAEIEHAERGILT